MCSLTSIFKRRSSTKRCSSFISSCFWRIRSWSHFGLLEFGLISRKIGTWHLLGYSHRFWPVCCSCFCTIGAYGISHFCVPLIVKSFLFTQTFSCETIGIWNRQPIAIKRLHQYWCDDDTGCSVDDNSNTCKKYATKIPSVFNCRFLNPFEKWVWNNCFACKIEIVCSFFFPKWQNCNFSGAARRKKRIQQHSCHRKIWAWNNCCRMVWKIKYRIWVWCGFRFGGAPLRDHTPTDRKFNFFTFRFLRSINRFPRKSICSENEGSAGSRVDIYQKLQERKQKQLADRRKGYHAR